LLNWHVGMFEQWKCKAYSPGRLASVSLMPCAMQAMLTQVAAA
jgi:hypothetical protein